jgi:HPt (histidine-containing phosphotransfer) domain-containing protein
LANPLRAEFDALLAEYRRELPRKLGRLQEHFAAGRLGELRRELHALAGSAGTFGLPEVSKAARAAEDYLEAGGGNELGTLLRRIEEQARAAP